MMKRTVCVIAVLLLALSLCACEQKAPEGPTWQEQYDLGVKYLSEGNYKEAIIAFTAAIEIDPKNPLAYIGRGGAYVGSGETEENLAAALADYEKAIELDETNVDAWLGLADVYIRMGEYDKAGEVLYQALEKTGNAPSIGDKLAELESGSVSDSSGNIRRSSHYNGSGALIGYFTYTYDSEGFRKTVTAYDAAGNQVDYGEYTRTDTGDTTRQTFYTEGSGDTVWLQKVVSEYTTHADGSGEDSQTYYDRDGNVSHYERHYYESAYRCVRAEFYDPDGSLTGYNTSTYDADGRELRESYYNPDGTPLSYTEYEYDENGNLIKRSSYDSDGRLRWYDLYQYDADGNCLGEKSYDGDGNLRYSSVNG